MGHSPDDDDVDVQFSRSSGPDARSTIAPKPPAVACAVRSVDASVVDRTLGSETRNSSNTSSPREPVTAIEPPVTSASPLPAGYEL